MSWQRIFAADVILEQIHDVAAGPRAERHGDQPGAWADRCHDFGRDYLGLDRECPGIFQVAEVLHQRQRLVCSAANGAKAAAPG